jgi:hypothetical protein
MLAFNEIVFQIIFADAVSFPAEFAGSLAVCAGPPISYFTLVILVNSVPVGQLLFNPGASTGVFSTILNTRINLQIGDIMAMTVQTDDPSFSGLIYTLTGMYA